MVSEQSPYSDTSFKVTHEAAVKHTVAHTLLCFMCEIKTVQCSTILPKKRSGWGRVFYYIINILKYNLVTAPSAQPNRRFTTTLLTNLYITVKLPSALWLKRRSYLQIIPNQWSWIMYLRTNTLHNTLSVLVQISQSWKCIFIALITSNLAGGILVK